MGLPPQVGELLPRADEAEGVRYKLATYSLAINHRDGGPKAQAFASILGISQNSIQYLETEIRAGILVAPVSAMRRNPPHGIHCVVDLPIRGLGNRRDTVVRLRTVWMSNPQAPPRLVSAYLKP